MVIPDVVNGKVVTVIGINAFFNKTSIVSIDLPDTITSINEDAFEKCSRLTNITIPSGVTDISGWAFYDCSSLSSINIPNGVTSIGEYAFYGCSGLSIVTIPKGVTCIGLWAFNGCSNLTNIILSNDLSSIGDGAFYGCGSLTNITIPAGVTSIGNSVFSNCSGLTSITIPNGVTSIGDYALSACSSLTNITIPNSVTSIGMAAFISCSSLKNIIIPSGVRNISDGEFEGCSSLSSITMPNVINSISINAFRDCTSLSSITILDGVTSIGAAAFLNCSSLTKVIIPNGVTNIGDDEFSGCSGLTSITIPSSVTSITDNSFIYSYNFHILGYTNSYAYTYAITKGFQFESLGDAYDQNFIVKFNVNCGNTIPDTLFKFDSLITNTPELVKEGWEFGGWYKDSTFSIPFNINSDKVNSDMTLFAKWTANVIFDTQGGTTITPLQVTTSTKILQPNNPVKTGYTFRGWYKEATCTDLWDFSTDEISNSTTLYAKFTINSYSVTFDSQGGNSIGSVNVQYNTLITDPTACTKEGYTFGGWYKDLNCTLPWTFETSQVKYDTTLYAKWTINYYTATFNSQGGSTVINESADYNNPIIFPLSPTKTGYTFGGWYKEAGCINAWNFTTDKVTTDTTIYAKWTVVVPGIPTSIKAVSSAYNSINVSWNTTSGANGYEVYRATSSIGVYTLISTTTGASYNNTGLTINSNYYYKVKAYRSVGTVKVYSGFSSVISSKPIPSAPASIKAASSSYNSINVSWSGVTGTSKYEVYRASSSAGLYSLVSTTTATSYNNTGLTTNSNYYYKVRSYRMLGTVKVYSGFSSVISIKPVPSAATNVKAIRTSSKSIKLTWNTVSGASGYEVFRATSSNGTYSLLTRMTYSYYTNSGLVTGRTYYYKIRSYKYVGNTRVYGNYWSAIVHAKP